MDGGEGGSPDASDAATSDATTGDAPGADAKSDGD
jgi:hypothetical protein